MTKEERDLLKDEISGLAAQLAAVHGMTDRGIKSVARRALKTGKSRTQVPATTMRISTKEDLLGDLEEAAIELGQSRQVMLAVTRGMKLVAKERVA